jgi:hypothetical protein
MSSFPVGCRVAMLDRYTYAPTTLTGTVTGRGIVKDPADGTLWDAAWIETDTGHRLTVSLDYLVPAVSLAKAYVPAVMPARQT